MEIKLLMFSLIMNDKTHNITINEFIYKQKKTNTKVIPYYENHFN